MCANTHAEIQTFSLRDATIPVDVLTGGAPDGGLGVTTKPPPPPLVVVVVASTDDSVDGRIGSNAIAGTGLCPPSPPVIYNIHVHTYSACIYVHTH